MSLISNICFFQQLIAAVKLLGTNNWVKIQDLVPSRSKEQCRERSLVAQSYFMHGTFITGLSSSNEITFSKLFHVPLLSLVFLLVSFYISLW